MRTEEPKFWPDFVHDIKFTLRALLLNILILPFYFFGAGFILSIALNSYLLGREFFESAAGYHLGKIQAAELGRQYKGAVYCGGFVITLLTLVPFLNILVPIWAVVWMVHVYHFVQKK
jgi:CysZ protein